MPIPNPSSKDGKWSSREELETAYEKFGWKKQIEFSWVHFSQNLDSFIEERWLCDASRLSCSCSGTGEYVYVVLMPSGIISTCAKCQKTSGPVSMEENMRKLGSRRVTRQEALDIVASTGQLGVPKLKTKDKFSHMERLEDVH